MSTDSLQFLAHFLNEGIVIDSNSSQTHIAKEDGEISKVEEPEDVYISDILYKGNNSAKVAICVYYENEEWISVKDKLFLEKILTAIGLNLDNVALVNFKNTQYKSVSQIGERLPDTKIISLGLSSSNLGNLPINQIKRENSQDYLCISWDLTEIAMSKEKKNVLWKNLKELFSL